jgi:hypothetical protein
VIVGVIKVLGTRVRVVLGWVVGLLGNRTGTFNRK